MKIATLKLHKYEKLTNTQKTQLINWVYWIAKDLEKSPRNADGMTYNLIIDLISH